jgi:hypothetical protein
VVGNRPNARLSCEEMLGAQNEQFRIDPLGLLEKLGEILIR